MAVKKVKPGDARDKRYRVNVYNPHGTDFRKVVEGKKVAEDLEREMITLYKNGGGAPEAVDLRTMTVRELLAELMESKANLAANSRSTYVRRIAHINAQWGDVAVSKLTRSLPIIGWLEKLEKTNGRETRRGTESLFRQMLRVAVREGALDRNPLDGVKYPKRIPVRGRQYAPTFAEYMALRRYAVTAGPRYPGDTEMLLALIDGLAGTGLRIGELIGLSVADIDWTAGTARIQRQVMTLDGKPQQVFGPPKTDDSSVRTVPLPNFVLDAFRATLNRNGTSTVTLPWEELDGPPVTHELLLHRLEGKVGLAHSADSVRNRLASLARLAGLPARLHPHSFRHRYSALLHDAGVPQICIDSVTGHKPVGSVTYMEYTAPMERGLAMIAPALDAAFAVASGLDPKAARRRLRAV